jgi:hypothetical protein
MSLPAAAAAGAVWAKADEMNIIELQKLKKMIPTYSTFL